MQAFTDNRIRKKLKLIREPNLDHNNNNNNTIPLVALAISRLLSRSASAIKIHPTKKGSTLKDFMNIPMKHEQIDELFDKNSQNTLLTWCIIVLRLGQKKKLGHIQTFSCGFFCEDVHLFDRMVLGRRLVFLEKIEKKKPNIYIYRNRLKYLEARWREVALKVYAEKTRKGISGQGPNEWNCVFLALFILQF